MPLSTPIHNRPCTPLNSLDEPDLPVCKKQETLEKLTKIISDLQSLHDDLSLHR